MQRSRKAERLRPINESDGSAFRFDELHDFGMFLMCRARREEHLVGAALRAWRLAHCARREPSTSARDDLLRRLKFGAHHRSRAIDDGC